MYLRWFLSCALALVGVGLCAPSASAEQKWVPGKRFVQSATRVMGPIQKIIKETNYGYSEGICVLAAFLTDKEEVGFNRFFDKGKKYAILGGGDDGVEDLDIIVTRNGRQIVADVALDAAPVVEFTAPEAGAYSITVKMAKSKKNGGFATICILADGGYSVPAENLAEALTNLITQCEEIDSRVKQNVVFTSGSNQWAVFGSIVRQNGDLTIEKLTPGRGTRVLISGGDKTTSDIDLALLDATGKVAKEDVDDDALPRVVFEAKQGSSYGFRVKNVKSRGASLILTAMLSVED